MSSWEPHPQHFDPVIVDDGAVGPEVVDGSEFVFLKREELVLPQDALGIPQQGVEFLHTSHKAEGERDKNATDLLRSVDKSSTPQTAPREASRCQRAGSQVP